MDVARPVRAARIQNGSSDDRWTGLFWAVALPSRPDRVAEPERGEPASASMGALSMLTKQIVLVAYYFPPLAGIASERAASLSRHLDALGWAPTVITPSRGFYHQTATWEDVGGRVVRTR